MTASTFICCAIRSLSKNPPGQTRLTKKHAFHTCVLLRLTVYKHTENPNVHVSCVFCGTSLPTPTASPWATPGRAWAKPEPASPRTLPGPVEEDSKIRWKACCQSSQLAQAASWRASQLASQRAAPNHSAVTCRTTYHLVETVAVKHTLPPQTIHPRRSFLSNLLERGRCRTSGLHPDDSFIKSATAQLPS